MQQTPAKNQRDLKSGQQTLQEFIETIPCPDKSCLYKARNLAKRILLFHATVAKACGVGWTFGNCFLARSKVRDISHLPTNSNLSYFVKSCHLHGTFKSRSPPHHRRMEHTSPCPQLYGKNSAQNMIRSSKVQYFLGVGTWVRSWVLGHCGRHPQEE